MRNLCYIIAIQLSTRLHFCGEICPMPLYKNITKNLQKVTIKNPLMDRSVEWINVFDAGKDEIEYLRKKYKFDLNHLKASLGRSLAQRPLVEQGEGYLFIILHFPIYIFDAITTAEIDFFVGENYIVTLHNNNIPAISDFFNFCKKEPKCLIDNEHDPLSLLLFQILEKLLLACYPILDQNSIAITGSEETIFSQDKQREAVKEILLLRRNIINLRKILQNHKNILKKLIEVEKYVLFEGKMKKHYFLLIEHSKRIWEILENQKEMIEVFNDTNESLMNFRMGDIMKTLTIISVFTFPLTLVAAIFSIDAVNGMPFYGAANNFWVVICLQGLVALVMLLFFVRKRWL
jgi:magnesium transporter